MNTNAGDYIKDHRGKLTRTTFYDESDTAVEYEPTVE